MLHDPTRPPLARPSWAAGLALAALLLGGSGGAQAALFRYTFSYDVGAFDNGDPLGLQGATATLVFEWDASALTPTFDGPFLGGHATTWPSTNTTVSLALSGTTGGVDGTYAGTTLSSWVLADNITLGGGGPVDRIQPPPGRFTVGGEEIILFAPAFRFDPAFNTPPPPGTVFPFAFLASDPIGFGNSVDVEYSGTGSLAGAQNVSGFAAPVATAVPAPPSVLLLGLGALGLLGYRRRRRRDAPA